MANQMLVATTLESILTEIRIDIFSRLDAKTLTRFRCVSKPFSSFVSTPDLISAHRLRSRQNPHLLFVPANENGSKCLRSLDINTKDIVQVFEQHTFPNSSFMVHTCLELVCMYNRDEIYIFNPTNKQSLPLPHLDITPCYPAFQDLMCSPVAFGCVTSTNEYKVVRTTTAREQNSDVTDVKFIACIFTVGKDKFWRVAADSPRRLYGTTTLVNEVVYYHGDENSVVSFDLAKEEWSVLPMLPFRIDFSSFLTELKGCLCLVENDSRTKYIDIWMLKNYDSCSWSKEYHIDKSILVDIGIDRPVNYACVLSIDKHGRLLISLAAPEVKLVYYDPRSSNFEDIHTTLGFYIPTLYLDSLMSLKGLR